jgi:4-hydroxy-4-methyl-2-oxoglutarate aldolase
VGRGPAGLLPLATGMRCVGPALPARHVGSVDVFCEALERSRPGDILVIDNAGRLDEACVGDLVTLEAQKADLRGIVVWGLHRDTDELRNRARY